MADMNVQICPSCDGSGKSKTDMLLDLPLKCATCFGAGCIPASGRGVSPVRRLFPIAWAAMQWDRFWHGADPDGFGPHAN